MSLLKFKVQLTANAEADLEMLTDYLSTTRTQSLALDLLDQIDGVIDSLEMFPERGSHPSELANIGIIETRQLVIWSYRIIYEIIGQKVEVFAILDGRRDMRSLLQQRLMQR
jgi:toxin ParE1/3/4